MRDRGPQPKKLGFRRVKSCASLGVVQVYRSPSLGSLVAEKASNIRSEKIHGGQYFYLTDDLSTRKVFLTHVSPLKVDTEEGNAKEEREERRRVFSFSDPSTHTYKGTSALLAEKKESSSSASHPLFLSNEFKSNNKRIHTESSQSLSSDTPFQQTEVSSYGDFLNSNKTATKKERREAIMAFYKDK